MNPCVDTFPVIEAVPVVAVDLSLAGLSGRSKPGIEGINAQGQRAIGNLSGTLGNRCNGQDAAASYEDGKSLETGRDRQLFLGK